MSWVLIKMNDGSFITGEKMPYNSLEQILKVKVPESDNLLSHNLSLPIRSINRMYEITEEQSIIIQQDLAPKYRSWEAWICHKATSLSEEEKANSQYVYHGDDIQNKLPKFKNPLPPPPLKHHSV